MNIAAEIESHQTKQSFSNLVLSNFAEAVRMYSQFSVLWCCLLLLYHLPLCLMFCVFRCAVVCPAHLDCNDCLVELLLASYPFEGRLSLSSGINKKL